MSQNPIPQGKYKPAVRHGGLIFTAGMTPRKNGVLLMSGKITPDQRGTRDKRTPSSLRSYAVWSATSIWTLRS